MEGEIEKLKIEIAAKTNELNRMSQVFTENSQNIYSNMHQECPRYRWASAVVEDYTIAIQSAQRIMKNLAIEVDHAQKIRSNYVSVRNIMLNESGPSSKDTIRAMDDVVIQSDKRYRELKQLEFPVMFPMLRPGEIPWWMKQNIRHHPYKREQQNRYIKKSSFQ